jgi:hypothetical protein
MPLCMRREASLRRGRPAVDRDLVIANDAGGYAASPVSPTLPS